MMHTAMLDLRTCCLPATYRCGGACGLAGQHADDVTVAEVHYGAAGRALKGPAPRTLSRAGLACGATCRQRWGARLKAAAKGQRRSSRCLSRGQRGLRSSTQLLRSPPLALTPGEVAAVLGEAHGCQGSGVSCEPQTPRVIAQACAQGTSAPHSTAERCSATQRAAAAEQHTWRCLVPGIAACGSAEEPGRAVVLEAKPGSVRQGRRVRNGQTDRADVVVVDAVDVVAQGVPAVPKAIKSYHTFALEGSSPAPAAQLARRAQSGTRRASKVPAKLTPLGRTPGTGT